MNCWSPSSSTSLRRRENKRRRTVWVQILSAASTSSSRILSAPKNLTSCGPSQFHLCNKNSPDHPLTIHTRNHLVLLNTSHLILRMWPGILWATSSLRRKNCLTFLVAPSQTSTTKPVALLPTEVHTSRKHRKGRIWRCLLTLWETDNPVGLRGRLGWMTFKSYQSWGKGHLEMYTWPWKSI